MIALVTSFLPPLSDRRAITALEYGLIAGALVAVIIVGVSAMGGVLPETLSDLSSDLS